MSARGGASWSSTYSKQYGKDRWSNLLQALSEAPNQLAFVAPNISHSALRYLLRKQRLVPCIIPNCLTCSDNAPLKENNVVNTNTAATVCGSGTTAAPTDCNVSDGPFSVPSQPKAEASSCPALHGNNTESVAVVDDDHVIEEARTKTYFLGKFFLYLGSSVYIFYLSWKQSPTGGVLCPCMLWFIHVLVSIHFLRRCFGSRCLCP